MSPTVAEVSLDAITHNLREIERRADRREVMAVLKANAYGHGAIPVARHLSDAGVWLMAVATLAEAVELREAGIRERILVFGAALPSELPRYKEYDLDLAIVHTDIADAVVASGLSLRVHLQVDTGMTRLGIDPAEGPTVLRRLEASAARLESIWTHFATSDIDEHPQTAQQLRVWQAFVSSLGEVPCPLHLSSSGGVFTSPEVLEQTSIVRAGIALYGLYDGPAASALRPAMRLVSRVARVTRVPAGTTVSYGARWVAPDACRIVTVAAGYGDGVPRNLGDDAWCLLDGRRAPIVGTICMDMLMLSAEETSSQIRSGDPVVLFGWNPAEPRCLDWASWAGTIPYEIVCRVSPRVPREYVDSSPLSPS